MSTEAVRNARELQMLEGMVDCAHELGTALGAMAKRQIETGRGLENVDAFQKCFQAVRMGIRLCMAVSAGRSAPAAAPISNRPAAIERPEALERERPEQEAHEPADAPERERDRDYEPVSLPKFLATLGVVARDAARLDDRLPAAAKRALPALQTLLARAEKNPPDARTAPVAGITVLSRPASAPTRNRLLGSAAPSLPATSLPGLGPPGPRPRSGFG